MPTKDREKITTPAQMRLITRQFDAVGKRGHSRQFDYVIDKIASTLTSPSQPTQLQATPQQTPIFTFRQSIPSMFELSRTRSQKWQGLISQPLPSTTLLLLFAVEHRGSPHTA